MEKVREFLRTIPFLAHFTHEEHEVFFKTGRTSSLKQGQFVELKKSSSLNIVINGMFEIETTGNRDVVYLSPGSFFGFLPFAENRIKGNVRALTDAEIFIINEDDFYRFFLKSHKALRGYLRMIGNMGFDINESGKNYSALRSKLITVYSPSSGTGKSYLASLLSLALSGEKVILLDLSYRGKTVFDFFNERITVPLSIKDSAEDGAESVINDRIVKYSDNIHLLNISFSSRVKTDPEILKPVILFLSRTYKYIVSDVSDDDHDLRNCLFGLSDFIFAITDGKKDIDKMHETFDNTIAEGQRIVYVRNNYINQEKGSFFGGLILNRCDSDNPGSPDIMKKFTADGNILPFTSMITGRSRALVLPASRLESILLCPLLTELDKGRNKFDYLYSSSYTFFLISLFLLFEDGAELKENMKRFFSHEQIAKNLDIVFPEKFIFSNSRILKYSFELASSRRMEMFHPLPLCSLETGSVNRMVSTGSLGKIMAASFTSAPEFQSVNINGNDYTSGFPGSTVRSTHLFRTEADDIFSVSLVNRDKLKMPEGAFNEYYSSSLRIMDKLATPVEEYLEQGRNLILDVSESEFKFDRIFNSTLKASQQLLTKIV